MDNNEREFYKKYREEHYCCPKCHSHFYSSTLAAYCLTPGHEDEYEDCNSVECFVCGWKGITHDLKPKPQKIGYKIGLYDYENLVIPYDEKIYDNKEEAKKRVDELSKQKRADGYHYTFYEIEIKENNRYIHNKTGNPYSLVTDNFMFKDNGEWRRGLILYKTEYYNPDGEYFARTKEDFKKNFTKV